MKVAEVIYPGWGLWWREEEIVEGGGTVLHSSQEEVKEENEPGNTVEARSWSLLGQAQETVENFK